ncbi:MAG: single-stranded DNA-binding protein [Prevotella sp.]|jgi:single-strand DNA-binding protein|nr:single-stranded DNA-binding protein [Prevotella sp.]
MNKVILIGNVGVDPEVRYYEADSCVARVRLATTEKGYVLQNGTRVPDRTDWHNLVFYRKLAKVVEQYVHKGDKLYVDGRLQYSQYDDKRGIQRTTVEIIVDNMEMLTPKSMSQSATPSNSPSAEPAPQQEPLAQQNDDTVIPF